MSLNLDKSRWRRVRFGDVAISSKEKVDPTDGSINRYVAGEHMDTDDLRIHRSGDVNEKDLGPAFHRRFRAGQVLYGSRRTYLRKVSVADFDGVCANTTFVVEVADNTLLLQEFLPFVMSSEPFHAHAIGESKGSVNPYVNWPDIAKFEFDLPPLDEQKRIASLLWAAERETRAQDAMRGTAEKLTDQWMISLASSAAGDSRQIREVLDASIGGIWGAPESESEVDVSVIRGTDITVHGEIEWNSAPRRSARSTEIASRLLRDGDLLIEKSGGSPDQPVGKVGLIEETKGPSVPSNFVLLARTNEDLCLPRYMFAHLRGMWLGGAFAPFTGKTTNISNLRTKELLGSEMHLPDLNTQRETLLKLQDLERLRFVAGQSSRAARKLSRSFSEQIFGGRQ